jgi:hypothetical protein
MKNYSAEESGEEIGVFFKTSWSGEDPFTVLTNTDIHVWRIMALRRRALAHNRRSASDGFILPGFFYYRRCRYSSLAECRFYGKAPFSVKPLHTKRL